jgi:hypothetical protein
MILTLEIPFFPPILPHSTQPADPLTAYEQRFGALPSWLDELSEAAARRLVRQALQHGEPLMAAECLD